MALVEDVTVNDGLPLIQSKTNTVNLNYTGRLSIIGDTATVDFSEPELQLTKTMSPDTGLDAGDTVTITLLLENNGTAPAYDISVIDTLNDAGTLFDLTSVSEGSTPARFQLQLCQSDGELHQRWAARGWQQRYVYFYRPGKWFGADRLSFWQYRERCSRQSGGRCNRRTHHYRLRFRYGYRECAGCGEIVAGQQ